MAPADRPPESPPETTGGSPVEGSQPQIAQHAGTDRAEAPGSRSFRGKGWFWIPIAPLIALDLWSKAAVFSFLAERYGAADMRVKHPIWGGPVSFDLVQWYNTGTVWGLFREFNSALVALRFAAIGLLIWFAWSTPRTARLQLTVLGMLLAGAVGNLYDNLTVRVATDPRFDGGVRDFLLFSFGTDDPYVFPAFNVADSCITVGALCLVVLLWRDDRG